MKVNQLLEARALQKLPKATDDEFDRFFATALFNHILEETGQKSVLTPQGMVLAQVDAFAVVVKDAAVFDSMVAWIRKNSKIDRVFSHATGRSLEVHRFPTFYMAFDLPDDGVSEQPDVIFVTRKRPVTGRSGYRITHKDDPDSMMFMLLDRALKNGKTIDVLVTAADGFHKVSGRLVRTKKSPVKVKTHEFGVAESGHGGIVEKLIIDKDADLRWELVPDAKGNFLLRDIRKKK